MWTTILAQHRTPSSVRTLILPGAAADEILLARALQAKIGWLQVPGGAGLNRILLNGATAIFPLPHDRMTVRAFLRPGAWPDSLAVHREPIAAEIHQRYVQRQRARKPSGDPALSPWQTLSPWLRRSNLALVDDIPNKLAAVGLALDPRTPASRDWPAGWSAALRAANLERLAEIEHGRFNTERVLSGWTQATRDPARFMSPYLQPWSELEDTVKDYDRETIADLPSVLAARGIGIRPV